MKGSGKPKKKPAKYAVPGHFTIEVYYAFDYTDRKGVKSHRRIQVKDFKIVGRDLDRRAWRTFTGSQMRNLQQLEITL
jgi:hypothetical protein